MSLCFNSNLLHVWITLFSCKQFQPRMKAPGKWKVIFISYASNQIFSLFFFLLNLFSTWSLYLLDFCQCCVSLCLMIQGQILHYFNCNFCLCLLPSFLWNLSWIFNCIFWIIHQSLILHYYWLIPSNMSWFKVAILMFSVIFYLNLLPISFKCLLCMD